MNIERNPNKHKGKRKKRKRLSHIQKAAMLNKELEKEYLMMLNRVA